jgi:hypothetical protein
MTTERVAAVPEGERIYDEESPRASYFRLAGRTA